MHNYTNSSVMSNIPNTPTLQNLIINFIGLDQFTALCPLFKLINDLGGNIIKSKINQYGEHITGCLLIDGRWDTITRLEETLPTIINQLGLEVLIKRTKSDEQAANDCLEQSSNEQLEYLPYKISINNQDEPGIIEKICSFFVLQEISIVDLSTHTYASEYNTELVQIDIKIKIPDDIHIPSLREQFNILCYNENLDASLAPYKTS